MNKLYTYNHKNITTSHEFEVKFKEYLNFLKSNDKELYDLLMDHEDFEVRIKDINKGFTSFFQEWLEKNKSFTDILNISNLKLLLNNVRTSDHDFDEMFSYSNLFKRLNDQVDYKVLYFYDISLLNEEEEIIMRRILRANTPLHLDVLSKELNNSVFNESIDSLRLRNFILIQNDEIHVTLKGKHCPL